jgi:hypothetical protein
LKIALDDIADLVTPEEVVLCEGGTLDGGKDFDADCYTKTFQSTYPHVAFLGVGNADDVQTDRYRVKAVLGTLAPAVRIAKLIDRDDRTNEEIARLTRDGVRVLSRRSIESYLLDDIVLTRLCDSFGDAGAAARLLAAKVDAVNASIGRGNPPDDLKSAAGDIFNAVKQLFQPRQLGSNCRVFMKEFCAPLITPDTPLYEELRTAIFATAD